MPLSTYLADKLSRLQWRGESYSFPATYYIGLSTTAPNPDGSNISEPSGGNYARFVATKNTTNWSANGSGVITNAVDFAWNTATADWGTLAHFVVWDASSGGNLLHYGPLAAPQTIVNGGLFRALAGVISFTYKNAA